ncbi:TIGR03943 family putative permease subunit [Pseudoclavibacter soli]|uniref:TIGR03943 family putative permease subunit n=1 Tax=Pseudoclavibacter soli TaxID=452623 RepID=UPI000A06ED8A|nr:TIGR03943 family protein [Pseudoclavibacter soli]
MPLSERYVPWVPVDGAPDATPPTTPDRQPTPGRVEAPAEVDSRHTHLAEPDASGRGWRHWQGMAVAVAGAGFVLWLAGTGQLALYIHRRYVVFSVIMCVIALALAVLAVALPDHDHDHEHEHTPRGRHPSRRRVGRAVTAAVSIAAIALFVTASPRTLSATSAAQRQVGTDASTVALALALAGQADDTAAATDSFTMRDWAATLAVRTDIAHFAGHTATITGFVVADADDPDMFEITRFVITCCALDAQPVSVPVREEGWRDRFSEGDWVSGTGGFAENASTTSTQAIVFAPDDLHRIEEPSDPYLS